MIFQSTLPVGGATRAFSACSRPALFQSTLPVGGATALNPIHGTATKFQSTLPVGGATGRVRCRCSSQWISIHAPRGGSDLLTLWALTLTISYFNPRSPWGERHRWLSCFRLDFDISIHAPRGGSDIAIGISESAMEDFNPRSPWGERLTM